MPFSLWYHNIVSTAHFDEFLCESRTVTRRRLYGGKTRTSTHQIVGEMAVYCRTVVYFADSISVVLPAILRRKGIMQLAPSYPLCTELGPANMTYMACSFGSSKCVQTQSVL